MTHLIIEGTRWGKRHNVCLDDNTVWLPPRGFETLFLLAAAVVRAECGDGASTVSKQVIEPRQPSRAARQIYLLRQEFSRFTDDDIIERIGTSSYQLTLLPHCVWFVPDVLSDYPHAEVVEILKTIPKQNLMQLGVVHG